MASISVTYVASPLSDSSSDAPTVQFSAQEEVRNEGDSMSIDNHGAPPLPTLLPSLPDVPECVATDGVGGESGVILKANGIEGTLAVSAQLKAEKEQQVRQYQRICEKLHIHPNSQVLKLLSTSANITELDLSRNYLGAKGIKGIAELLPYLPSLTTLNLSFNRLTNEKLLPLLPYLCAHPTLTTVLLNGNAVGVAAISAWMEKLGEVDEGGKFISKGQVKLKSIELIQTHVLKYHKRKLQSIIGEVE